MLTEDDICDIIKTLDAMARLSGILVESIHTELERVSDVLVRHFGDWEEIGGKEVRHGRSKTRSRINLPNEGT